MLLMSLLIVTWHRKRKSKIHGTNYITRENPSGFLVVPGESEFQKKIIIRSDL